MSIDKAVKSLIDKYNLTVKQAKFVLFYTGNATEAAKKAGYRNPGQTGYKVLNNAKVQQAIHVPQPDTDTPSVKVYDRAALIKYWSEIIDSTAYTNQEKIKASENLARAQAVFVDRQAIMGQFTHEHLDRLTDNELKSKVMELLTFLNPDLQAKLLPAVQQGDPQVSED